MPERLDRLDEQSRQRMIRRQLVGRARERQGRGRLEFPILARQVVEDGRDLAQSAITAFAADRPALHLQPAALGI